MDLKDFVAESLIQIAQGVSESQLAVKNLGGLVNPAIRVHKQGDSHVSSLPNGQNIYIVDFNVAISVAENTGTEADGKLKVASVLSIGGGVKSSETNSTLSKVSFKVPLALPVDPYSLEDLKKRDMEREAEHQRATEKRKQGNKSIF
ncbi:hypothetical protein [Thalassotalea ganghwensis]